MRRDRFGVVLLAALTGCSGWFGKKQCEEDEEKCDGRKILTCTADIELGGTEPTYKWRKTGTCALMGSGLTCRVEDGVAECVPESALGDGGLDGAAPSSGIVSGTNGTFSDAPELAAQSWLRVDVTREAGSFSIAQTAIASLTFTPAAAVGGQLAAVTYGADGKAMDAVPVSFPDSGTDAVSVWLRSEAARTVRLVKPGGAIAAEAALGAAADKSALTGAKLQSLEESLPPTLAVVPPLREVPWFVGSSTIPLTTVAPPPQVLDLVSSALRRLPPFAASVLTAVAFTAKLGLEDLLQEATRDASAGAIELAGDDPDGGAAVAETDGLGDGGTAPSRDAFAFVTGDHTALAGTWLVINASAAAVADYQRDPEGLMLEVIRQVARLFVRLSSADDTWSPRPEDRFAFPSDFPPEIADLLKRRVSPLLAPFEGFRDAWGGLHGIAVEAELAAPYADFLASSLTAAQAVENGFAAPRGARGAGDDFAEYLAYATVVEKWAAAPCSAIRSAPLDVLSPRLLVHVAKLEALWGLGLLRGSRLSACVGSLPLQAGPSSIVALQSTGERLAFDMNVEAGYEVYAHGETHVTLSAERETPDGGVTAALSVSFRTLPLGLVRLTPVGRRPDPEVGASFLVANVQHYASSEASGGLILVTRLDSQRIEAHALMVQQGKTLFGDPVLPLVTARYDIPEGGGTPLEPTNRQ